MSEPKIGDYITGDSEGVLRVTEIRLNDDGTKQLAFLEYADKLPEPLPDGAKVYRFLDGGRAADA